MNVIREHLKRLDRTHKDHLLVYGEGNNQRLTGAHETSNMETFSYGEGNRGASVRIPVTTLE